MMFYEIVRYYHPAFRMDDEVIKRNLTLAEAQEHCNNPETETDYYFDAYRKQE